MANLGDSITYGNHAITGDISASNLSVSGNAEVEGTLTAANVNTGQGANELYDMNQNVKTYSNVTFNNLTINGNMLPESSPYLGSVSVSGGYYNHHTPSRGLYNSSSGRDNRGASIYGSSYNGGDGPYCGNSNTRVFNPNENYSKPWYYARF